MNILERERRARETVKTVKIAVACFITAWLYLWVAVSVIAAGPVETAKAMVEATLGKIWP